MIRLEEEDKKALYAILVRLRMADRDKVGRITINLGQNSITDVKSELFKHFK